MKLTCLNINTRGSPKHLKLSILLLLKFVFTLSDSYSEIKLTMANIINL